MTEQELDEWYGRQPFDNVKKITHIDLFEYSDETDNEDESRDKGIEEARKIWDSYSFEEKQEYYEEIGDNW
jgi:hypothetical protein